MFDFNPKKEIEKGCLNNKLMRFNIYFTCQV